MRTNQVNTLLPSLPRLKKKESNYYQVAVAGCLDKVKRFWEFMKFSGYRLSCDYQKLFDHLVQKEDLHVVMQLEETPYFLSRFHRKESVVHIQTDDGRKIEFPLLNVQIVEMPNRMVYIQGKSYDIFANPDNNRRRESVLLDCKVVDSEKKREFVAVNE
ncbi:hypothetical protein MK805_14045 [Shimazuella sp. AN120528]|uniref:hypothetical protein n=1 Tax=Shimazuella soli TaxID=1892854 RepID=UPI001F10C588|nr:hypothetical protein [Shimazuella soli]MCH5586059.1 hypothetical protein [Shimazuella soli]